MMKSHAFKPRTISINILCKTLVLSLFFTLLLTFTKECSAAITVNGITDKTIYADSVSFSIPSQTGYEYTATLNNEPIDIDTTIDVKGAEYYEVNIIKTQTSTSNVETKLVRFIIRASARLDTEWGLPVWTPFPMTTSANSEFTGSQLEIVTPAQYPTGLEIPVVALIHDETNKRFGVNGYVSAQGFEDSILQIFRGVGSTFLSSATQASEISYNATIGPLQKEKQIIIEDTTTWQEVSGNIITSTNWGENARIKITSRLTINAGVTLEIGKGSVILITPETAIKVNGTINTNGTKIEPVTFTSQDRNDPWGGFLFQTSASQGNFQGTIFTASGANQDWFNNSSEVESAAWAHRPEECLMYTSNGANVTLTNCYVIENHGQLGHTEDSYLTLNNCLVQKAVTCGQYNSGSLTISDSALIEMPSAYAPFVDADNDTMYLNGGPHTISNTLIGWTIDDGIDAGQGETGIVNIIGCWFESCIHEAMALSSGNPRNVNIQNTVAINCGQGIECGYDEPLITATNCLLTENVIGARFGDNYSRSFDGFLDVKNSLMLFNHRDVWGRNWDDWNIRLSQMDIQNNYLSIPNENHPNNTHWDPILNPGQLSLLEPFLSTAGNIVGVSIAELTSSKDIADLKETNKITVRLSTFTKSLVTVDYSVRVDTQTIKSGTLEFIPGQSLADIDFVIDPLENFKQVKITLTNPVNAELTGISTLLYQKPYEIVNNYVVKGDSWDYFKGTSEPPADWNTINFIPETPWLTGVSGFGYESNSGYQDCTPTKLNDMEDGYISLYTRKLFTVENPENIKELTLLMDFDDGYIAYINGVPVDNKYGPDPVAYNEPATTNNHEACCGEGCTPDSTDLTDFKGLLIPGVNVIAIQAHNTSLGSSDFILIPQLIAKSNPTPGDIEPDGDVDMLDYSMFADAWLSQNGQDNFNSRCDLDPEKDNKINIDDLSLFVENWLSGK